MEGFIKLHRQIVNNWVWEDKPFSKGQAWVDLIIMANHCDKKFLLGSTIIDVQTGQIITSEHKLMKRWGWSKTKVRTFLELLETDKMLVKNSDKKKTTLTLCNYKEYHEVPNHKKTTERPVKDPIKNVKNEEEYITPIIPFEKAVEDFKDFRKKIGKPMTDHAVGLLRGNLKKLAGDDESLKIAIIEQSIFNGWQGVFALKDGFQKQQQKQAQPLKPHIEIINGEEVTIFE